MMWIIWLGTVWAAPVTELSFDDLTVEGKRVGPSVELVQESPRTICPDTEEIASDGWVECVVNLSYQDIKRMCQELGPNTVNRVQALFHKPTAFDGFDNDVMDQEMTWKGCFYNSRSGGRMEEFHWRGTGGGWLVTDVPQRYHSSDADRHDSFTVFDGQLPVDASSSGTWSFELPTTYAYLLRPMSRSGMWTAVPSTTNQDEINELIDSLGFAAPYCGSERLREDFDGDCKVLPRLAVVALSRTMMAVQSYQSERLGYLVSGIFWRSETGFDIAQNEKTSRP